MEQKYCRGCEELDIDKIPGCPLQCRTVQCKAYKKKPIYDFEIMPIVWVMGGPGSGKMTQCRNIATTYGLTYLSPGAMIRQEIESGSDRARCLNSIIARGGLVPNDVVLGILKDGIEKAAANESTQGFVINGFPREKTQGLQFERSVGQVSLILYLNAPAKTLFNRMKREPKNAKRIDETREAMELRLETYMKHYEKVVELYKYRLVKIDADKGAEEIFAELKIPMDELMRKVTALKASRTSEQDDETPGTVTNK